MLGGIPIPSPVGPDAHSDGDAILHAVCDACLGAAGLDDLGTLFSDRDPQNRDRDSIEFCRIVRSMLDEKGLVVASIDLAVETEQPKIKPHRDAIRAKLAELFGLAPDRVNVKGKTGEGLDAVGRGEAIRVTAVALLMCSHD